MKIRDSQIAAVLQDLKYPAAKRQILAEADPYGTNGPIKALLWALGPPVRQLRRHPGRRRHHHIPRLLTRSRQDGRVAAAGPVVVERRTTPPPRP
jgi:hypothetical protein